MRHGIAIFLCGVSIAGLGEAIENPRSADVEVIGHVVEPVAIEVGTNRALDHLRLPPGFEINVFASNLVNPRMIAVANDGAVYITRRSVGDVVLLRDSDGDGTSDMQKPVASCPGMHGIALDGDTVYLTTVNDVYRCKRKSDGTLGPLERIIDDLPDGGQHPNRTLAVGPDGKLYISVGSTCNDCGETNPENATLLRAEPDGSSRTIFASGLRNTIGFAFHPDTNELWGMDHGIDWLGDNEQHEELNLLREGEQYGWPYVYTRSNINPGTDPPAGISSAQWAKASTEPVGLYTPHAAPMQLAFYRGKSFPKEYHGDAFIAMRGSWNRKPPSGYEVVRIHFENERPKEFEPFLQGFLVQQDNGGWGHLGRLAGLAVAADGSLLVSDDTNGVVYRIHYTGDDSARDGRENPGPPTNLAAAEIGIEAPTKSVEKTSTARALAMQSAGVEEDSLSVQSDAFEEGAAIPKIYGARYQNISPPLRWEKGPEGTKSYAIIVEDPDVTDEPPFLHWTVYNLPNSVTELPEGMSTTPRLSVPEGTMQGRNDYGSTGYTGMNPPGGTPAHTYHFQVFALNAELDVAPGTDRATFLTRWPARCWPPVSPQAPINKASKTVTHTR